MTMKMSEEIKLMLDEKIEPELLDEMVKGYQVTQVLYTAMDYDIFTSLEKPRTAKDISDEVGTDFTITKKFLNVLVALKLISEIDGKYTNTTLAGTFLVKDKPFYQGNAINMYAKDYDAWSTLGQALKEGGMQQNQDEKSVFDKSFILGAAELSKRGPLPKVIKEIRDISEFKNAKKLLDLGGGHGLYAIAFAQLNPDLEAIVFDFPPVVEVTKEFIPQYGMEDRVKVMSGDFNKDDFGDGYDIIFVSHSLFSNIKGAIQKPLEKIYKALNDGGILISNHWMLNVGESSLTIALQDLWVSSLLGYPYFVYNIEEFVDLLQEKKFSGVQVIDISTPEDPAKIVIAKKEVK